MKKRCKFLKKNSKLFIIELPSVFGRPVPGDEFGIGSEAITNIIEPSFEEETNVDVLTSKMLNVENQETFS